MFRRRFLVGVKFYYTAIKIPQILILTRPCVHTSLTPAKSGQFTTAFVVINAGGGSEYLPEVVAYRRARRPYVALSIVTARNLIFVQKSLTLPSENSTNQINMDLRSSPKQQCLLLLLLFRHFSDSPGIDLMPLIVLCTMQRQRLLVEAEELSARVYSSSSYLLLSSPVPNYNEIH